MPKTLALEHHPLGCEQRVSPAGLELGMWPEAHLGQGRATGTHECQRPKVVEGSKQAWVGGEEGGRWMGWKWGAGATFQRMPCQATRAVKWGPSKLFPILSCLDMGEERGER